MKRRQFVVSTVGTMIAATWPLVAMAASPIPTTVPPATSFTDNNGTVWTINAGVPTKNGTTAAPLPNPCTLLLWWTGNTIYAEDNKCLWYLRDTVNKVWKASTDPRGGQTSPRAFFHGINVHPDYTGPGGQPWTAQDIVNALDPIGAKCIRVDTFGFNNTMISRIVGWRTGLDAMNRKDIKIVPCLTFGFGGLGGTTEASNYSYTQAGAQAAAQQFFSAGILDIECGNELVTHSSVFHAGTTGFYASDYTGSGANGPWSQLRGAFRGAIDGCHAVSATIRCGVNFTVNQTAGSDMMWTGKEPDGSTGHPTVKWDITTWHNYSPYGQPFQDTVPNSGGMNMIQYIASAYGKPIMMTEWNNGTSDDVAYMNTFMNDFYNGRNTYNIESIHFYQLGGGIPQFGLYAYPDKAQAYKDFTAAHPNP